jgi:hypothetical protein
LRRSRADQGSHCFDRHKQDALAKSGRYEPVVLVKSSCGLVDGMDNYAADSGDLRGGEAASQCLGQKRGPDSSALPLRISGKASDQEQTDLRGEAASKFC